MALSLFIPVLLIFGLFLAGIVTLIVVLMTRNKPSAAPLAAPQPVATATHEDRQAILKKLADGELTKPEAEEQLNQLGTPVPVPMPAPPPPSGSSAAKGCLIALLIVPLILLLLLLASYFGVRDKQRDVEEEMLIRQIEHVEQMREESRPAHFEQQ